MKSEILKQMISIVDSIMDSYQSDFYKYDLHTLINAEENVEFVWSVRRNGTDIYIISPEHHLKIAKNSESYRFCFAKNPGSFKFVMNQFKRVEHHVYYCDGSRVVEIKTDEDYDAICSKSNTHRALVMKELIKEFPDEEKCWNAEMPIHFDEKAEERYNEILKTDEGELLKEAIEHFHHYSRCAVDEEIRIFVDHWDKKSFEFCLMRNGYSAMNGGIIYDNGKWTVHT